MDTVAKCRKCNGELDRKGKPEWCKSCWAAYHREYEVTKDEMVSAKAFCEGAEAMRKTLVRAFLQHSIGVMYGSEVARYIGMVTPPRYGEQPIAAPGPQPLPSKTAPDVAIESR